MNKTRCWEVVGLNVFFFSFHEQSYINSGESMVVAQAGVLVLQLTLRPVGRAEINCCIPEFCVSACSSRQLLELKEVAIFKDRFRKFLLGRS